MKYTIYCILQPGELEVQTLLLLSSLRKHLRGDYRLYACIPEPGDGNSEFHPKILGFIHRLGVTTMPFTNSYLHNNPDPMPGDLFSNKYYPLPELPEADYTVFLDSDMLMIRDLKLSDIIKGADFHAKPVCYMNETRWEQLYGLFGLNVPLHRIRATIDQQEGPPYFNGGLFAIRSNLVGDLFNTWVNTFEKITRSSIMANNPVNREQVALAISIARLGYSYHPLTEEINFPARSKQIQEHDNPYLIHYHDPESIYKNKKALTNAGILFVEYPEMRLLAAGLNNWRILTDHVASPVQIFKRLKYRIKGRYQSRGIK